MMILACGDALIDMIATPDGGFHPQPGGAAFNTAIGLARLGCDVDFFCGLSGDLFGQQLCDALRENGVGTDLCPRPDRPTTLAFAQTDASGAARYVFYDEQTASRMLHAEDLPDHRHPQAALFGGISLVSEPCGTSLEVLFHRLHDAGVTLMLDPNIRPGFITHERIYRKRLDRMIEAADIVKLSDEDLAWLMGPGSITTQSEALLARGPSLVIVTEGARGVRAHTQTLEVFVAAQEVEVVDTIGAGDAFNAGLLAGLRDAGGLDRVALRGLDQTALRTALETGTLAAALTVTRAGAQPPNRAELNALRATLSA